MRKILQEYILGDMTARYETDEERHVGLILYPTAMSNRPIPQKHAAVDSLVQIKLVGDAYEGCYASGNTLRNSESVRGLVLQSQTVQENARQTEIYTTLMDDRGYEVIHKLVWKQGDTFVSTQCDFCNRSRDVATLELLSSFSLEMISPWLDGDGHGALTVHRLRSRWSQEGQLESLPIEALQLDTSWNMNSVRCERFGQIGSLPVNNFFPWLFMEDTKNHVFWGALLYHGASWQMEIFRKDENLAVSGGLADRQFGHWKKMVRPGESFSSPRAVLTVCKSDSLDIASGRLVQSQKRSAEQVPETERNLPFIFNEFCTTWGNPTHENILEILKSIKGRGFTYFVIDCGWYKKAGVSWDVSMGDYEPSKDLFPEGLEKTVSAIKAAGLKPGIWFEFENVGPASKAYENTEHLLKLDGYPLTTSRRRFWNMNDPWVIRYLDERLIGMLKKYGFEYLKVDYNDTIGMGCDGCESPGEGLRQNIEAAQNYFKKISREIPGIVIENCASGGHRLEPGFMALTSMASFSDAHECEEIPVIAANLHRAILPEQSQIWAVLREKDSMKRIAYSLINTFLGRMCLSGDVTRLSDAQWKLVEKGMDFYRRIRRVIKDGQTFRYGPDIKCIRHPEGWQGIYREGRQGEAYAVIHIFGGELPELVTMKLPLDVSWEIAEIFSDTDEVVELHGNVLSYRPTDNEKAVAVRFTKKELYI